MRAELGLLGSSMKVYLKELKKHPEPFANSACFRVKSSWGKLDLPCHHHEEWAICPLGDVQQFLLNMHIQTGQLPSTPKGDRATMGLDLAWLRTQLGTNGKNEVAAACNPWSQNTCWALDCGEAAERLRRGWGEAAER